MFNLVCIKSDLNRILKDTILMPLLLAPMLVGIVFKIGYSLGIPWVINRFSLDLSIYSDYILAMVISFIPVMLGIVMGFMMIEDKDDNIIQLFMVTPMEIEGYLINRMAIIGSFSFIYTIINYYIMSIHNLNVLRLIIVAISNSILAITVGMFFFTKVSDKIKGLTYAKGFNLLSFFVFAPFIKSNLFNMIANIVPTYWLGQAIAVETLSSAIILIMINIVCFCIMLTITNKKITAYS